MSWKKIETGNGSGTVTVTDTSGFFYEIENMVKPEKFVYGWMNVGNGTLNPSTTAQMLETEVLPNTKYILNFAQNMWCYDEKMTFISTIQPLQDNNSSYYGNRPFVTPANCKFIRVNVTGRENRIMIIGDKLPMNNRYNSNVHPAVGIDPAKKYTTLKMEDTQDAQSLSAQLHVLHGKKINWLGDSITMGNYAEQDPATGASLGYNVKLFHEFMAQRLNILCRNYGIGGTGFVRPNGQHGNYITRAAAMDNDADVVVVYGGTNDGLSPLGIFGNGDVTTVYGAIQELINVLRGKYPTQPIVFMVNFITNSVEQRNINTAVREVCDYNYIPYIELSETILNKASSETGNDLKIREKYFYNKDGTHPNTPGMKILARHITRKLTDILLFK